MQAAPDASRKYHAATIGAVVCAAIFPVALFAVFLLTIGIAELFGRNTNPVAGIMFLSIAMTRAYPALLLCAFILGLPMIVWALHEHELRPAHIVAIGALTSFILAAGTICSVGLLTISILLAAIDICLLAAPLFLCFCLFACWIRVMNGRSTSTSRFHSPE